MIKHARIACVGVIAAIGLSACGHGHDHHGHQSAAGEQGDLKNVSRTIEVAMTDTMRFSPALINVKQAETIRFIVKNTGQVKHEMVLGTMKELKAHAEAMKKHPDMEHDDPNQAVADSGKSAQMIWRFTNVGEFDFACLQPGHFEAGMVGKVRVDPK